MSARRLVAVAYALAALAAPAALRAQEMTAPPAQNPRGLFYHLHVGATEYAPDGGDSYFGYGGGGLAGYNLNRYIGLFVGFDFARPGIDPAVLEDVGFRADDNFVLTHVELGGRLNIPLLGRRLLPYVDAAYARRALSYSFVATDDGGNEYLGRLKYVGNNVLAGAGAQLFVRPTVAVDLGARVSVGELDHAQMTTRGQQFTARTIGDSGLRFSRVTTGVTWYYPTFQLRW